VLMTETFVRQYGLTATNLFLFNHESLDRPRKFVTSKIVYTAIDIYKKKENTIVMGNCDVVRDWIWARELLEFVVKSRNKMPSRLVLGSGIGISLREFAETIFDHLNLDFGRHLRTDEEFPRPDEIMYSKADCQLARLTLDWSPQLSGTQVAKNLIHSRCVDLAVHE
jgi:GDPmannose 4,6-dehydratase